MAGRDRYKTRGTGARAGRGKNEAEAKRKRVPASKIALAPPCKAQPFKTQNKTVATTGLIFVLGYGIIVFVQILLTWHSR